MQSFTEVLNALSALCREPIYYSPYVPSKKRSIPRNQCLELEHERKRLERQYFCLLAIEEYRQIAVHSLAASKHSYLTQIHRDGNSSLSASPDSEWLKDLKEQFELCAACITQQQCLDEQNILLYYVQSSPRKTRAREVVENHLNLKKIAIQDDLHKMKRCLRDSEGSFV